MNEYRYGGTGITADYARGGIGFALCFLPLVLASPGTVIGVILSLLSALFGGYVLRTWRRQNICIRTDDQAIRTLGPLGNEIYWNDLTRLKLSYYSTRRDKEEGWMQLVLKGSGLALRVDTSLEGFAELVAEAAANADRRGIELTPTTVENLKSLGIGAEFPDLGGGAP